MEKKKVKKSCNKKHNPLIIPVCPKKLLLTGGHAASTAFVVVEEIRRRKLPWEIYWIGFHSSFEGRSVSSLPSIYFPEYGIKTYSLFMGRLQRKLTIHSLLAFLKIPAGFIHALFLLLKIKPSLILSFGGFSAFPVVVVAYLLKVPVIIHEQTSVVGRANKFSSIFAKKITIARETSREYFPAGKTVLVGNPVPKDIIHKKTGKEHGVKSTLLVTGGQSGAEAINTAVEKILSELLQRYRVIHLTGLKDEEKFKKVKAGLFHGLKKNYEVYGMVDPKKYSILFNSSDILLSRAGANTVSKIIVSNKPSVLVPLPISYMGEQEKNALLAKKFANVLIIPQKDMTDKKLLESFDYLVGIRNKPNEGVKYKKNPDTYAAERLVELIEKYIK